MSLRLFTLLLLCCAAATPARAAQDDELVSIELRAVSEAGPGRIVIDRGSRDALVVGDLVTFLPRSGPSIRGSVRELSERSSVVELFDPSVSVAPGTKGVVRLPAERVKESAAQQGPPTGVVVPVLTDDSEGGLADEEARPWRTEDEEWRPGMPLLGDVGVLRPEERAPSIAGRIYSSGDQVFSNDGGRGSGFYRLGSTMAIDNAFGRGEQVTADFELVYRNARNPDGENEDGVHLRIDQLSYGEGDTRFSDSSWEAGRFLQSGMPEFGFLDGFEWGQRLPGGDTWGVSVGYMPEPTPEQKTGEDLQFAGYYRWISDSTEQLTASAGYQKSFHHTDSDRDLVVTRVDWLPHQGWNFLGTAWIDFYNGGDAFEESGTELTLARLSTGRRWDNDARLDFTLSHQAYASLERFELQPMLDPNLLNGDQYTRLAVRGEYPVGEATSMHGGLGGWTDVEDSGGDVTAGLEWQDVLLDEDSFDTTLFATAGKFNHVGGTRFSWGRFTGGGRWDLFYEVSYHHVLGFSDDRDDILQHWLGVNGSITEVAGWNLSLRAETIAWDSFQSWSVGFYTQKSL